MKLRLLGGLTARAFLQRHWQKRPLLVRAALPGFRGVVDAPTLLALAARDDVESRLVQRRARRYDTAHGPFAKPALSKTNATILVSGLNLHLPAADALLRRFAFIPQARLDDVMASYATPGGGVGPHVDSYDVFLVQGEGRRRWKVWKAGKRIIDCVVEPGDLLYLPPGLEHEGVALETCFTYSVGFRAPRGAELAAGFLDWLNERGLPDGAYRDPGLRPARRAAAIPPALLDFAQGIIGRIRWTRADLVDFLGRYLTEPKPHVVFAPSPTRRRLEDSLLRLDPRTQLLHAGGRLFINGESLRPAAGLAALRELADRRSLPGRRLAAAPLAALVSQWLRAGYAHLDALQR